MDAEAILTRLVGCRSDRPDQPEIGAALNEIMQQVGLEPSLDDHGNAAGSTGGEPVAAFVAHADTFSAGSAGWTTNPLGEKRDNEFFGRGAAHAKGSIAAMLLAAARLKQEGVAGIRLGFARLGAQPVLKEEAGKVLEFLRHVNCRLAVCGEPTGLRVVTRHQGRIVVKVTTLARRAHRLHVVEWTNAIEQMWEFIRLLRERRYSTHLELGRASAAVRSIGTDQGDWLPYHCALLVERNTLPGEDENTLRREVNNLFTAVAEKDASFEARVEFPYEAQPLVLVDESEKIVRQMLEACKEVLGSAETARGSEPGLSGWMADAGARVVSFGPGDPLLCHGPDEKVEIAQVEKAAEILYLFGKRIVEAA
jgi:acetylornithine deacetylase/succinyl-diaminopimelate desuccinylase-like protein